jgi:predicted DNA-binding transcriptional regulator AlpA
LIDISGIPLKDIPAIITALASRLIAEPMPAIDPVPQFDEDRLLTTAEGAAMLGHSTKWIYRHAADLPFAKRIGPRDLRFSLHGLRKWQSAAARRAK